MDSILVEFSLSLNFQLIFIGNLLKKPLGTTLERIFVPKLHRQTDTMIEFLAVLIAKYLF